MAISLSPGLDVAYYYRGRTLLTLGGRMRDAVSDFRTIIANSKTASIINLAEKELDKLGQSYFAITR